MITYVLVHGAWHGGWCWKKVTPLLRASGYAVFTPTLTGLGERSHLLSPDVSLHTHIQDVVAVLEYEDLREVVLVGHSYGGMVITGVAERVPERLSQLVYLDAFVPEHGQSLFDIHFPEERARFQDLARTQGDGWRIPRSDLGRDLAQWGVTEPDDVAWMRPRIGAQPLRAFTQSVQRQNPAAQALPRAYIRCTQGPSPTFAATAARVRADQRWHYRELPTRHDAMVTMPQQLAVSLLELVESTCHDSL
jgi:pimeloyl-ACP methyl ester carboxylesterase